MMFELYLLEYVCIIDMGFTYICICMSVYRYVYRYTCFSQYICINMCIYVYAISRHRYIKYSYQKGFFLISQALYIQRHKKN